MQPGGRGHRFRLHGIYSTETAVKFPADSVVLMRNRLMAVTALAAIVIAAACGGGAPQQSAQSGEAPSTGGKVQINGAGATFPNPIYSKWFAEYTKSTRTFRSTISQSGLAVESGS